MDLFYKLESWNTDDGINSDIGTDDETEVQQSQDAIEASENTARHIANSNDQPLSDIPSVLKFFAMLIWFASPEDEIIVSGELGLRSIESVSLGGWKIPL